MRYPAEAVGSALTPKLMGTYESEVAGVVESIVAMAPDHVVVVGAAEGYYAVGLLMRCAALQVTAFETSAVGRERCVELAQANGVAERLVVLGNCQPEDLTQILQERKTQGVIMDVEGDEQALLNPVLCPGLSEIWVLVETHDALVPSMTTEISDRFADTHDLETIDVARSTFDPEHSPLVTCPGVWADLTREWRPPDQQWLWMHPRVVSPDPL